MKKTIIALIALSGMAVGEEFTATFTSSEPSKSQTYKNYTADFGEANLTLSITNWGLKNTGKNQANGTYTAGSATTSIRPNVNVGNGGSYTLNFTLTNTGETEIRLSSVSFDAFLYNAGGTYQLNAARTIKLTLGGELTGSTVYTIPAVTDKDSNNIPLDNTKTIEIAEYETPITINANESIDFTLMVSKGSNENAGTFVGLKSATFEIESVPEPATATLSLLALAGLAMRRRRK